jgi:hypothetical protein
VSAENNRVLVEKLQKSINHAISSKSSSLFLSNKAEELNGMVIADDGTRVTLYSSVVDYLNWVCDWGTKICVQNKPTA